jgi:asparagine synthase (glutamine-hydrolysing)
VDSGALATVATEVAGTAVETISIGFDQPEFDETEAAAAVARELETRHRAVRLTGQMILDGLPEVLGAIDQPTIDGFNTYYVSKAAREAGLTVVLSGLGGDELFGGYHSFRDVPRSVRLRGLLRCARRFDPALACAARWTGGRRGRKAAEMFLREPSMLQMYLLRREQFLPEERRLLHPLPEESEPASGLPAAFAAELATRLHGADGDVERQVSACELSAYMGQMLLRDSDVFSMAHGLELRVPLLDHALVEEAVALPGAWKRPDPRPKPLLIDAVGGRLPRLTYAAPKRGFAFPWDAWLRSALRPNGASLSPGMPGSAARFDPEPPRR